MLKSGHILDGKYEVIKTLGQGGMSAVYLCKNLRLENLWAIKEVKKEVQDSINFLAEPNILKNLSHTGIPRVVDIFHENYNLYMVEDYIEGETLEDFIKRKDVIEPDEICSIALNICDIVSYLHSFNPPIIYRDLKPSNIMITPLGKVVLIDFGISRVYKQNKDSDTIYMGSKGYAAPEQYGRGQTCIQTDIYGLGAVIYYMITKKAPKSLLDPLKDDGYEYSVDNSLKNIVQRCMQIDVSDRYSSIIQLQQNLQQVFHNHTNTVTDKDSNKNWEETLIINSNENTNVFKSVSIDYISRNLKSKKDNGATKTLYNSVKNDLTGTKGIDNLTNEDSGTETKFNINKTDNSNIKENILKKDSLKEKKHKKILSKKLIYVAVLMLFVAITAYIFTGYDKKEQPVSNNVNTENNASKNNNTSSDSEKNNVNKDKNSDEINKNGTILKNEAEDKAIIVEGILNKNSPILLSGNYNNNDKSKTKGNGKNKGNSKHDGKHDDKDDDKEDSKESNVVQDVAYKLNPFAMCGIYSGNFKVTLQYIEVKGNNISTYCSIENSTSKTFEIKNKESTYLVNDKGEYTKVNLDNSTDISKIPPKTTLQNVKTSFSNFNINTSQIILKAKINEINLPESKDINLIVKVQ
ncbi:serine/threonine-protein kinase [Clostridium sp. DJ247]|uniref:serine/threonine-protein kinase n=1 Tax=Clostridium sp. DJ247 TaxID=2726188 RepID=UPI0016279774|nr:serine/threonine-protein kinase [Clostridium sp. DJ247]MBC2579465.1 protein kinase [Clostridium sp. DJ247]